MFDFLKNLFANDFMPHGHCYLWSPGIVWLNVISDALITLAYYSIPLTLLYFVRRRRDIPYPWIFIMFGGFIVACGTTHVMEIWTVWNGTYRLAGLIKAVTAALSVATALLLVKIVPEAMLLRSPSELARVNADLQREIGERERAEQGLRRSQDELEHRVQERTEALAQANRALEAEVAERKRAEQALKVSLVEKETLLKEIHHRVKNNLQLISSVLQLQSGYITNPEALAVFRDGQSRIRSMALIHDKLYRSSSLAFIDFAEYVRSLVDMVMRAYRTSAQNVNVELRIEPVSLDLDVAIPFGLILNELISNSLKHAFPDHRPGRIVIALERSLDGVLKLTVEDDGVGLPDSFDREKCPSLGIRLVNILAEQLHAKLELRGRPGTAIKLVVGEPKSQEKEFSA